MNLLEGCKYKIYNMTTVKHPIFKYLNDSGVWMGGGFFPPFFVLCYFGSKTCIFWSFPLLSFRVFESVLGGACHLFDVLGNLGIRHFGFPECFNIKGTNQQLALGPRWSVGNGGRINYSKSQNGQQAKERNTTHPEKFIFVNFYLLLLEMINWKAIYF